MIGLKYHACIILILHVNIDPANNTQ